MWPMVGHAYHPAFGTEIRYRWDRMPEDPDAQVRQTMAKVLDYIEADASHPIIQAAARRALELGGGDPVVGTWLFVTAFMRFREDFDLAADLAVDDSRKEDVVEVLIRPIDQAALIALRGVGVEDCDGWEMLAACLLTALGVPCALVTVSADEHNPEQFSHVYLAVYENGERIAIDFSHGPYIGWECPNLGRLVEWPVAAASAWRVLLPVLTLIAGYVFIRRLAREAD